MKVAVVLFKRAGDMKVLEVFSSFDSASTFFFDHYKTPDYYWKERREGLGSEVWCSYVGGEAKTREPLEFRIEERSVVAYKEG